ncbi:hypothetical protein ACLI1C_04705 [Devosia sp. XGJD_8]|uniref:hypothetical protein n=1 Tax=Devosia sp. XGJD_8 TaxID=3391187 RepID=UPI00398514A8
MTDDLSKPTLYIKSNIIDLYFVSESSSASLDLIPTESGNIVYVIGIDEKADFPFYLFSAVEIMSEKTALSLVLSGAEFDIILFNDYALEIARTTGRYNGKGEAGELLTSFVPQGPDYAGTSLDEITQAVSKFSDDRTTGFSPNVIFSEFQSDARSSVISGLGNVMHVAGFSGATEVHEMLPQIVGDHTLLHFVHSPEVAISESNKREFADAIIVGDGAALSIQAKCFDFDGEVPPTSRANAEKRMRKNVTKAISQTRGSSRMVREGRALFAKEVPLKISNDAAFMFCIFVPCLDLIYGELNDELAELGEQLSLYGQHLVVLDPMQFLRTLQAAGPVSESLGTTPEETFFHLLGRNSQQAASERNYTRPILYRW